MKQTTPSLTPGAGLPTTTAYHGDQILRPGGCHVSLKLIQLDASVMFCYLPDQRFKITLAPIVDVFNFRPDRFLLLCCPVLHVLEWYHLQLYPD